MFCLEMTASVPQLIPGPMAEQLSIANLIFSLGIHTVKILMAWR